MWLWLQNPAAAKLVGLHEPLAEQSVVVVKGPAHTVAPHVMWGFPQAPGHLFCGLHTVSDTQMVGSFSAHKVPMEEWVHLAVVYHASVLGGSGQRRMECVVNGRVEASVVAPNALRPLAAADNSTLIVGGSQQYHPAAPGIVARVLMHHRQALDVDSLQRMMRQWPEAERPSPRLTPVMPAPDAVAPAAATADGQAPPVTPISASSKQHVCMCLSCRSAAS